MVRNLVVPLKAIGNTTEEGKQVPKGKEWNSIYKILGLRGCQIFKI